MVYIPTHSCHWSLFSVFAHAKFIAAFAPIYLFRNTIPDVYRWSSPSAICKALGRPLRKSANNLTGSEFNTSVWWICLKLSEAANKKLLTHWGRVYPFYPSIHSPSLAQIMACRLTGAIIRTNAGTLLNGPFSVISMEIKYFHSGKCIWKCRLEYVHAC